MNTSRCQAISAMENWDDAIAFTEAKIEELKDAIRGFMRAKQRGEAWPGTQSSGHKSGPATQR